MQGRRVRGAYVVAAIGVAFVVAIGLLVASGTARPGRPSDNPDFESRIVVPEEFRRNFVMLCKGPGPSTEERDGYELYRESFVWGWNDCLEAFVADWDGPMGSRWSYEPEREGDLDAPWVVPAPDEVNAARRDGWRACVASLKEALKTSSEEELRKTLARSPGDLVPAP